MNPEDKALDMEQLSSNSLPASPQAADLVGAQVMLDAEAKELLSKIISESDFDKSSQLTQLFNINQNKKTLVRLDKFSSLLDAIAVQAYERFTKRPDEISNKELLDGMKIMQDLIERGTRQVSDADTAMPLIQINQTNNEVNVGGNSGNLSRESRDKVQRAVTELLKSVVRDGVQDNADQAEPSSREFTINEAVDTIVEVDSEVEE